MIDHGITTELYQLLQEIRETAEKEAVSQYLLSQIDRACGLAEIIERQDDIDEEIAVLPW